MANQNGAENFIFSYLSSIDSPRSLTAWLLYINGEHHQLATLEWHPSNYNSYEDASSSFLATKFLSKYDGLKTGLNLEDLSMANWMEQRDKNALTNSSLSYPKIGRDNILFVACKIIGKVLNNWQSFLDVSDMEFGPGASSTVRGDTAQETKYIKATEITTKFKPYVLPFVQSLSPQWAFQLSQGLRENNVDELHFVPKDSKSLRTIGIGPDLSILFQKMVGKGLRRILRCRCKVDLDDQSTNRSLARRGSIDSSLCTIDLKGASDSISISLVEQLFPKDFLVLIDALRSPFTKLPDGRILVNNHFSCQGNGYTFELETLIFWALAKAIAAVHGIDDFVSVYGDDIVVGTELFARIVELFPDFGFTINTKKSFSTTPFRESCGGNYWNGVDITPFYLRTWKNDLAFSYFILNSIEDLKGRYTFVGKFIDHWLSRLVKHLKTLKSKDGKSLYFQVPLFFPVTSGHRKESPRALRSTVYSIKVNYLKPRTEVRSADHAGLSLCRLRSAGSRTLSFSNGDWKECLDRMVDTIGGNSYTIRPRAVRYLRCSVWIPRWFLHCCDSSISIRE